MMYFHAKLLFINKATTCVSNRQPPAVSEETVTRRHTPLERLTRDVFVCAYMCLCCELY